MSIILIKIIFNTEIVIKNDKDLFFNVDYINKKLNLI